MLYFNRIGEKNMERQEVEILLQEKLIKLLQTSISFDSRSNRHKTYSLLGEASQKRSAEQTNNLIELIDKQIRSFEADSIKNYFKENASKYEMYKDEIDLFIKSLDNKNSSINESDVTNKEDSKLIEDVEKTFSNNEYDYFDEIDSDRINDDYNKLTRDEIDGFMKKIDDKLAELEAEASALENKNQ